MTSQNIKIKKNNIKTKNDDLEESENKKTIPNDQSVEKNLTRKQTQLAEELFKNTPVNIKRTLYEKRWSNFIDSKKKNIWRIYLIN